MIQLHFSRLSVSPRSFTFSLILETTLYLMHSILSVTYVHAAFYMLIGPVAGPQYISYCFLMIICKAVAGPLNVSKRLQAIYQEKCYYCAETQMHAYAHRRSKIRTRGHLDDLLPIAQRTALPIWQHMIVSLTGCQSCHS